MEEDDWTYKNTNLLKSNNFKRSNQIQKIQTKLLNASRDMATLSYARKISHIHINTHRYI